MPCFFTLTDIPLIPSQKEEVYNHIKKLYLPYTIVDVGWWYQIAFPALPSGKIDYMAAPMSTLIKDGNTPSALTDLRDIGKYIAKIIDDERTLNKYVLAYDELWTPNQVYDLLEKLSGETLERKYVRCGSGSIPSGCKARAWLTTRVDICRGTPNHHLRV